jgi:hypothetical protein
MNDDRVRKTNDFAVQLFKRKTVLCFRRVKSLFWRPSNSKFKIQTIMQFNDQASDRHLD